ncbi:MAG: PRC-barrel domain-containing protein [Anaerolineae bacterium]
MQFYDETPVLTADEEKVGQIDRVVIDPSTGEVSHLIVEKGFFFPEDKVIPVSLVAEASAERVLLKKMEDQLDLQPFTETEFIPAQALDNNTDRDVAINRHPYYAYPAIGTTASWGTGWFYNPLFDAGSVEVTERNIPDNAIALDEGAEVYSSDDEHVGDIDSVFTTDDANRITHFVISQGIFFDAHKLIPVSWIKRVEEEKVLLGVHSETLDAVPNYDPESEVY